MLNNPDYLQEWKKLQLALEKNQVGQNSHLAESLSNWFGDIDNFWQTQSEHASDVSRQLYEKLQLSNQFFTHLSEPMINATAASNEAELIASWFNNLQMFVKIPDQEHTSDAIDQNNKPAHEFWQLPISNWQQQLGAMQAMVANSANIYRYTLSEKKTTQSDNEAANQRFIDALLAFHNAYMDMVGEASTNFLQEVQRLLKSDFSLQQVSSLWVSLFEKYYADFVRTDWYARLFGELINAWIALIGSSKTLFDNADKE